MKNVKYANNLPMVLDVVKKNGIVLANLARKLGVDGSTVLNWRSGRHAPNHPERVVRTIMSDALFLEKFDIEKHDIRKLRDELGITDSYLAEELGITGEALSQQIDKGITNWNRKHELQGVIRQIGKNLRSIRT
jgi:DNA-binding transcriptional regulator YiaG